MDEDEGPEVDMARQNGSRGEMVSQEVSFNDVHRTKLQGTYIKKIMLK